METIIDNTKMWESLITLLHNSTYPALQLIGHRLHNAYEDAIKKGEIVSIKPEPFKIKKGMWYMCIKDNVNITKGNIYKGIADGYILDDKGQRYNCNNWAVFQRYFRPATEEEIPHKFKVGDWLCENEPNNYARFMQILETVNIQGKEKYRISRDIHNDEDVVEFDFVEKYYHKFDIKDAKDGDVLSYRDGQWIFIFKKNRKEHEIAYHALISDRGLSVNDVAFTIFKDAIDPATKEQRDTLFNAMREKGYEWDAEKKELSHPEVTKISEQELTEFEKELANLVGHYYVCKSDQDTDFTDVEFVKEYSEDLLSVARKQFIEEACEYIRKHINDYYAEDFRKALEK